MNKSVFFLSAFVLCVGCCKHVESSDVEITTMEVAIDEEERLIISVNITNTSNRSLGIDDSTIYFFVKRDIVLSKIDGREFDWYDEEDELLDEGGCILIEPESFVLETGASTNMMKRTARKVYGLKELQSVQWKIRDDAFLYDNDLKRLSVGPKKGVCPVVSVNAISGSGPTR